MEEIKKLLVLLGNENDEGGDLSEVSILRAKTAIEHLKTYSDYYVIPTGAFGEHFNKFTTPHGHLLRLYLIKQGINPDRILPHTKTSNTLEDAFGVLRCVNNMRSIENIHIVTSKFHMPRVKYIFGRILQNYEVSYHEADDPNDVQHLTTLLAHETRAIDKIQKEWVDVSNFDLNEFPSHCYENIGHELRHYDTLSYLAIAGAFFVFGFLMSNNLPKGSALLYGAHIGGAFIVALLWYLYLRLASTAASARRVLFTVEKLYGVPGISSTTNKLRLLGTNFNIKDAVSLVFLLIIMFVLWSAALKYDKMLG